jgi:aspartyl-tRNA(Asn)/glutamyl-tRNA(Gln) amidotransferase subunit B
VKTLGLPAYDASVLVADRAVAELFDACVARYPDAKKLANWFMGELLRVLKEKGGALSALKVTPEGFAELLGLVDAGTISGNAAKQVFAEWAQGGGSPKEIVEREGLAQVSDVGALEKAVDEVLARSPQQIAGYKAGKTNMLGYFVGQAMKALGGKGNPALISELVKKKLG